MTAAARLFVVIHEPRQSNPHLRALVWHVKAYSKTEALREYRTAVLNSHAEPGQYVAPRAELVVPGTLYYV